MRLFLETFVPHRIKNMKQKLFPENAIPQNVYK